MAFQTPHIMADREKSWVTLLHHYVCIHYTYMCVYTTPLCVYTLHHYVVIHYTIMCVYKLFWRGDTRLLFNYNFAKVNWKQDNFRNSLELSFKVNISYFICTCNLPLMFKQNFQSPLHIFS